MGLALQSHTCLLWRVSSHTPLYLFFFLRFKCTIKKKIYYILIIIQIILHVFMESLTIFLLNY